MLGALMLAVILWGAQSGGRHRRRAIYEAEMQDPVDDPPDAWKETEFAFARLRFRSPRDGFSYSRWAIDSNKSERQFILGVRRLTRDDVADLWPVPTAADDKYSRGVLGVVAGSERYAGAAVLAVTSAVDTSSDAAICGSDGNRMLVASVPVADSAARTAICRKVEETSGRGVASIATVWSAMGVPA